MIRFFVWAHSIHGWGTRQVPPEHLKTMPRHEHSGLALSETCKSFLGTRPQSATLMLETRRSNQNITSELYVVQWKPTISGPSGTEGTRTYNHQASCMQVEKTILTVMLGIGKSMPDCSLPEWFKRRKTMSKQQWAHIETY